MKDCKHLIFRPLRRRIDMRTALGIAALLLFSGGAALADPPHFNHRGDLLISDQYNNRVIEIDRSGNIVWQFGVGPNDVTAKSIIGVNDAQRVGNATLMAGT